MCRERWPGSASWTNAITREAYFEILTEWEDPAAIAGEWMEMSGPDAVDQLARQLRKDLRQEYDQVDEDFMRACCHAGIRQVDFHQVAQRLLCYAPRTEEQHQLDAGDADASG
jgi:hypothetical protein